MEKGIVVINKIQKEEKKGLVIKNKNEIRNLKEKGITLIALVITIIVLLILARSGNCNANWRKWNINKCNKCK